MKVLTMYLGIFYEIVLGYTTGKNRKVYSIPVMLTGQDVKIGLNPIQGGLLKIPFP